jgi:hypothetical protein
MSNSGSLWANAGMILTPLDVLLDFLSGVAAGLIAGLAVPEIRNWIDETSDSRIEHARHYIPQTKQNFAVPPGTLGKLGLSLMLALDAKVFEFGSSVEGLLGSIKVLPSSCTVQVQSCGVVGPT